MHFIYNEEIRALHGANEKTSKRITNTLTLAASTCDRNFLPLLLPAHPERNSGPRVVSAVKVWRVERLDSKTNPIKFSFKYVHCC